MVRPLAEVGRKNHEQDKDFEVQACVMLGTTVIPCEPVGVQVGVARIASTTPGIFLDASVPFVPLRLSSRFPNTSCACSCAGR